jgi:hypothetical protein
VWKRGSQSLFRREDGAPAFGPRAPWQGSSSVPLTGGMEARPHDDAIEERATVRGELRAARPLETTMNGGGGPAGPSRFPPRTVHTGTRRPQAVRLAEEPDPRFDAVRWVPTSVCRLLIEWRSILPVIAVHPAIGRPVGPGSSTSIASSPLRVPMGRVPVVCAPSGVRGFRSERFRARRAEASDEGQTGFRAPASRVQAISVAGVRVAQSIACAESSLTQV